MGLTNHIDLYWVLFTYQTILLIKESREASGDKTQTFCDVRKSLNIDIVKL